MIESIRRLVGVIIYIQTPASLARSPLLSNSKQKFDIIHPKYDRWRLDLPDFFDVRRLLKGGQDTAIDIGPPNPVRFELPVRVLNLT